MSGNTPAPLTPAERVVLRVSAQTLRHTTQVLRFDWATFAVAHPDKATPDVHRGYLLAIQRISHMVTDIERNANAQGVQLEERHDPEHVSVTIPGAVGDPLGRVRTPSVERKSVR